MPPVAISLPAAPPAAAVRPVPPDLDALLMASGSGDHAAFERLYRLSCQAVYAQVRRTVWQRCEAEDVLQATYLNVWRHASRFDPEQSQAITWMSRIARNGAIDHLRRSSSRQQHEVAGDLYDEAEADDDRMADPAPTPAQQAEQRQRDARVDALLQRLSTPQRQVLVLAYRDGLSQLEIAEHLGAPLGTVKSWMRRGLLALRHLMQDDAALAPAEPARRNAEAVRA